MNARPCKHCNQGLQPRPQNPNQTYCSKPECQRARKQLWQKMKLKSDPDYQGNHRRSQKKWRSKNLEYWKQWRADHPEYVIHNRKLQMERNAKLRNSAKMGGEIDASSDRSMFAKMDASIAVISLPSMSYQMMLVIPADCKDGRVNMEFLWKINQLFEMTKKSSDCKDRT